MQDSHSLVTPIAFLVFNRPETTRRVFDAIAWARPQKLLVVADGPRAGHPTDVDNCIAARAVVERVDWPCEVLKNYSDVNLGCRRRVSSGIDWVFSKVGEAIILEDDCVPGKSFFSFCEALLCRYRDDERIMHVSGVNFQQGFRRSQYSYYFSRLPHIWGWATWRRAWEKYDVRMKDWPWMRANRQVARLFPAPIQAAFWESTFDQIYQGHVDTWDGQWVFANWLHCGLAIAPDVNLVSNVGAGSEATHTKGQAWYFDMPAQELTTISHPPFVFPNYEADDYTMNHHFGCGKAPRFRWGIQRLRRIPSALRRRAINAISYAGKLGR